MHLSSSEIVIFFVSISLMLFVAKLFGEILRKFKQPAVIGEIIAGIIIGPTLFGYLFPEIYQKLFSEYENSTIIMNGITTLGVVMLMLVSGLEVDLGVVLSQGKPAFLTSLFGVFFPFVLGFGVSQIFPNLIGYSGNTSLTIFGFFIGTAVSITALPVVARTLMDLKIFKTKVGSLIIASAMFNDLVGWIIFSLILGLVSANEAHFNFGTLIILLISFVIISLTLGKKFFNFLIPIVYKKTINPGGILNFVFILGFLGAAFTEFIGVHAIFGAFIIGIAIGDSAHLKIETRESINQFVTNIFAPLFFVSIGLRTNFVKYFNPEIVIILLVIAFTGKILGSSLGSQLGGVKKLDSFIVGFGLNAHGVMEIVLGLLALQTGIIDEKLFVALVMMAIITSVSCAPLMNIFIKKSAKTKSFNYLLTSDKIFFTSKSNKEELLKEMSSKIAEFLKVPTEKIFTEVWKREQSLPTGIQNYLAIPHARLNIDEPIALVAISNTGIDFSAFDGINSRIIILILTPISEAELQLNLLSEISNKFKNKESIENILKLSSPQEILNELKKL